MVFAGILKYRMSPDVYFVPCKVGCRDCALRFAIHVCFSCDDKEAIF